METIKKCCHCKQALPLSDFANSASRKDGKHQNCRACTRAFNKSYQERNAGHVSAKQRANHIKRAYGLSEEEYAAMLASQGGVCAICNKAEGATHWAGKVKMLHIDHDHATGEIRGLLCDGCNRGLGHFRDDPANLLAAAAYLQGR